MHATVAGDPLGQAAEEQGDAVGTGALRHPPRPGAVQVLRLGHGLTIGRLPDNDLALVWDDEVSRRHAHIRRTANGWVLVDDSSRNGSYLNGERVTERWDGRERWTLFAYERPTQALSAEVDPNRVLLLDVSPTNNSRTLEPQGRRAATKWSAKWLVWLQDCLLTWAALV